VKNLEAIRFRYLKDDLSIRLGGLAANMARIASFSEHTANWNAVNRLLEESKFFIEWLVPDAPPELQEKLVDLQIQISVWHLKLLENNDNSGTRKKMADQFRIWSNEVLSVSGLSK